jgi:D-3-phosphoglycerate dehydrogenase
MPVANTGSHGIGATTQIFNTQPARIAQSEKASTSIKPFGAALFSEASFPPPKVHVTIGESLGKHAQPTLDSLPKEESILFSAPPAPNAAAMNEILQRYMHGKNTDLLVIRGNIQVNKAFIESLPLADRPKFVLRAGTGMNNIDKAYLDSVGIQYNNTPDVNTRATAELALATLFSAARRIPQANQAIKAGTWNREPLTGIQLKGKTIGIVGLGAIGTEFANLAKAIGMKVVGLRPRSAPKDQTPSYPVDLYVDTIMDLMQKSNVVSVHVPLTPTTKKMIGKAEIEQMPKNSILLNMARENVIDESAVLDALNSGHLFSAAIDVFQEEKKGGVSDSLANHPNLIATPHIGGQTQEACEAMGQAVLDKAHALYQEKIQTELAQSRPMNHTKPH